MDLETFKQYFDVKIINIYKNDLYANSHLADFKIEHKLKRINNTFSSMVIDEENKTIDEILNLIWLNIKDSVFYWADKIHNDNKIGTFFTPI